MAKSGLTHIDVGPELTRTEWESEESHALINGTSFPVAPVERQLFYRNDLHEWFIFTGSAWVSLQAAGSGLVVHDNTYHDPDYEQEGYADLAIAAHGTAAVHVADQPPAVHDNAKHSPDFEEEGVAATQIETHRTAAEHTQDQPSTFLKLSDTPAAYTGQAGKYPKVNVGESALEFGTPGGAGDMTKAVYDPNDDGVLALAQLDPLVCSEAEADAKVSAHAALGTGIHGVGGSTVESIAGSQSKVDTHAAVQTAGVHGSTAAATPNKLIHRDAAGRAKVVAPAASDDIAQKAQPDAVQTNLDTHAALTTAHSAVSTPTASRMVLRDASARAKFAAPAAAGDVLIKGTAITDTEHGTRGSALHADSHARSHDHSSADDGTPIAVAGVPALPASKITSERFPMARIPDGTSGWFLKAQGAGVDPVYASVPGGGDMLKSTYDPNDDGVLALAQLDPLVCSEAEADAKVSAHAALTATHGATGAVVGTTNTQTLTNKTLIATTNVVEEISTDASSATPTPTGGSLRNFYTLTALAAAAEFAAPSGTPANANRLIIRIKDNATARTLTWNAIYRRLEFALPTTTVISKTMYLGFIYNSADSKWDMVAINEEA